MSRRPRLALATLVLVLSPVLARAAEEEGSQQEGWGPVVARVVNFAILVGALTFLLKKPLAEYFAARTEEIRRQLADAAEKGRRATEEKAKAEARLGTLDQELSLIRERARSEAEAERQRILAAAAEEAARIQTAARREIGAELELARRELAARAAELAVTLAQKKLAGSVNQRDREILFEKSLSSLERLGSVK